MPIKLGSTNFGNIYLGSTKIGEAYLGSVKVYGNLQPPVLPAYTIRCKFTSGYTPSRGTTQTLVDANQNIWDIWVNYDSWDNLFDNNTYLERIIAANLTGVISIKFAFSGCTNLTYASLSNTNSVTNMQDAFSGCTSLKAVPHIDTNSVTDMQYMFYNCYAVETGALALYQQVATKTLIKRYCFTNCGRDTVTGAAELAQIPASWGGTGT